jgi:ubiquinone/menaquinone biosynthesis C-methylase UbiE
MKTTIEEIKKYWNDRPCNIKHSNKKIGTKAYFNEVERKKYFVEPHIPIHAEFKKYKNKDVLEVGCGIGTDTINFLRNGAKLTTMDLSEKSLELTKKRVKLFNFKNKVKFINGNAENLLSLVDNKKYDLIYSFGVIHHTSNPEKCIENFSKLLKPNGELKIMVYNRHSWKVFWILMKSGFKFWKLKKMISKYSEAQTGCPVTFSYTKNEFKNILKKYGFECKNISIEHIFPYKIDEYKKGIYKNVWYFRFIPNYVFKKIESVLGWHLCVTAKLK